MPRKTNAKRDDIAVIFVDSLKEECVKSFDNIPTKSKTFTGYLSNDLGITPSVFNDARRMFYNNVNWISTVYDIDEKVKTYTTYGCMAEDRYQKILRSFKLKDTYRVPNLEKSEVEEIEMPIKPNNFEERFVKAFERIADAQESQVVMLEKIFTSIDEIEKHWRPMRSIEKIKPVAKLEKKEEKANG